VKQKYLYAIAACALFFILLAAAFDSRLRVVTYEVPTEKLTEGFRLAVLTDLHSCAYGEGQRELLDAVEAQAPDAAVLVGDIVDDVLPQENAWTVVSALAERMPCFYVTGNHEWWSGEAERICEEMESLGVTVLRGESELLSFSGGSIQICGIDDPDSGESGEQLASAGSLIQEDAFTILLAHRPEEIQAYLRYSFDLILSGHAHGGQWRIPGLLNGLYAPNQGWFPAYAGGRYDFDRTTFLVSRGLARETTRVPRIFNRPEVVIVDLVPADA
jgi:predicted MPP superfamily phosphohydrolase